MTFGADHYVPVLKVKRGEKAALRSIPVRLRRHITPLLEIVERRTDRTPTPTVEAHLNTAFKELARSLRDYPRCFIDTREIAPDGPSAAAETFQRAAAAGLSFTPVTGIARSADIEASLQQEDRGVAVRLTRAEFEQGGLTGRIRAFLTERELTPERTDLILDLGTVGELVAEGVTALTGAFLADVPDHEAWRTLTVSACAFPMSMGGVDRHSSNLVDRVDWLAWRNGLHSRSSSLQRLPTFSDSGIQHPSGVEGFDPRTMQVSAAIRYTLRQPEAWLLIKGESTRVSLPSEQFPLLATRLVYGAYRGHFAGGQHCEGCRCMKAAADGAEGLGSAEAWRRLGTIHHITTVMEDLASLPST